MFDCHLFQVFFQNPPHQRRVLLYPGQGYARSLFCAPPGRRTRKKRFVFPPSLHGQRNHPFLKIPCACLSTAARLFSFIHDNAPVPVFPETGAPGQFVDRLRAGDCLKGSPRLFLILFVIVPVGISRRYFSRPPPYCRLASGCSPGRATWRSLSRLSG